MAHCFSFRCAQLTVYGFSWSPKKSKSFFLLMLVFDPVPIELFPIPGPYTSRFDLLNDVKWGCSPIDCNYKQYMLIGAFDPISSVL